MKQKTIVRLTESDLHTLIKESVQNILREYIGDDGEYGRDVPDLGINDDHYSDDLYDTDDIANAHDWQTYMDNDTPERFGDMYDQDQIDYDQMAYDDAERDADLMDFNEPDPEPEF